MRPIRLAPKASVSPVMPIALAVAAFAALPAVASAQGVSFALQFGSPGGTGSGIETLVSDPVTGGFAGGSTWDNLFGPSAGVEDAYVVRIDDMGVTLWSDQFGTPQMDIVDALAVDGNGGVFVIGDTRGDLAGPNQGAEDIFLAHYDASGTLLWAKQIGDFDLDIALGAVPDGSGGFVISGFTNGTLGAANFGGLDAFIARYDSAGNQLWFTQFGSAGDDEAGRLASDGFGGYFVAGATTGSLGGPISGPGDAFVAHFDSNGVQTWLTQFGSTNDDAAHGVIADGSGGVYVSGGTLGSLYSPNQGAIDLIVARFDATGNFIWGAQEGSAQDEFASDLAQQPGGVVVAMSTTFGNLVGASHGGSDIALHAYDATGTLVWSDQIGTNQDDESLVAVGDTTFEDVTIGGNTQGSMYAGAKVSGGSDSFILTYEPGFSCYAECDTSTTLGVLAELDIFDFLCFQNSFVSSQPYACDCDTSTGVGVCDIFDFLCFQNAFVGGCQ